mmetsp:Transcript_23176/g.60895  ORF Transcript_23176/g.60895 Transcript_23176/m.60895 type:complete len:298 (-) Transcript_23176:833-1726(-)
MNGATFESGGVGDPSSSFFFSLFYLICVFRAVTTCYPYRMSETNLTYLRWARLLLLVRLLLLPPRLRLRVLLLPRLRLLCRSRPRLVLLPSLSLLLISSSEIARGNFEPRACVTNNRCAGIKLSSRQSTSLADASNKSEAPKLPTANTNFTRSVLARDLNCGITTAPACDSKNSIAPGRTDPPLHFTVASSNRIMSPTAQNRMEAAAALATASLTAGPSEALFVADTANCNKMSGRKVPKGAFVDRQSATTARSSDVVPRSPRAITNTANSGTSIDEHIARVLIATFSSWAPATATS